MSSSYDQLKEAGLTDEDIEDSCLFENTDTEEDAFYFPSASASDMDHYDFYYEDESEIEFNDIESRGGSLGKNSSHNQEDHESHTRKNIGRISRKVDIEKILVITNFVLELPSAVFDQLSSVHKPQYALLSMLMSFAAIFLCIVEFVYKARQEKVTWKWSRLPWLYYPSQTHKPFGNFKDIIGLVCALCQCIVTGISFDFAVRHADNPFKISVWPIVFAFGLLCSKFLEKPERST
ncbi:putative Serine/threonine-protein kinase PBS1 [Melia azedarach]|uniref:Serine/threonine-protein kinase PBS1 n=1 Tax=Melia azedarach TaxID=155640 RepID=A0ACC1Y129_MELAZ|nr:putative Serine/threonine-protein kinase PBS1 [Melia azedarach]